MLATVNSVDSLAFGRLMEFLSPSPPWNRSLWGVGLVLSLQELSEACKVLQGGMLSDGSVKQMCSALQRKVGADPVLSVMERNHLRHQINNVPKAGGLAFHTVDQMGAMFDADYLLRWARVASQESLSLELFARSVASHILDMGFSPKYIHGLLRSQVDGSAAVTLSDLCEELQLECARSPVRPFQALLAFKRPPRLVGGIPGDWLRDESVTNWLTSHGFDTSNVRAPVAMVLTVEARDADGAARVAREISDRFAARLRIATGASLERQSELWIAGHAEPVQLGGESRGVRVKELDRESRIFQIRTSNDNVDAALELLAHLDENSAPAAIAGGWGAIEGLLADPGDRATAADNLASLVACSFPRQELTSLSFKLVAEQPAAAALFGVDTTNRSRSLAVARLIQEDSMPALRAAADRAAVERMRKLLKDPHGGLRTIKDSIAEAFHRLYRQRNMILHGGHLDSVTLKASLRTVAKLAGAGMDRITHGHYVQSLRPLELVARANLSMAIISKESALACVDLLESR